MSQSACQILPPPPPPPIYNHGSRTYAQKRRDIFFYNFHSNRVNLLKIQAAAVIVVVVVLHTSIRSGRVRRRGKIGDSSRRRRAGILVEVVVVVEVRGQ